MPTAWMRSAPSVGIARCFAYDGYAGRAVAETRHRFMEAFVAQFLEEWGDGESLQETSPK